MMNSQMYKYIAERFSEEKEHFQQTTIKNYTIGTL